MKKILIVNNNLDTGGIQRSLVNLVREVCNDYEITLLLFSKSGALLGEIPKNVKVITPNKVYKILGLDKNALKSYPLLFIIKAALMTFTRLFSRRAALRLLGLFQRKISGYDAVISYSHMPHHKYFGNGCAEFVLDKTVGGKRICFIHCDYLNFGGNTETNNKAFAEFDKIACCSDSVTKNFLIGSGVSEDKVCTVRNFYDLRLTEYPKASSVEFNENDINILIIARLSPEKGISRAVKALFQSKRRDIHLYIIGDGPQRAEIQNIISEHGMDSLVTMLGEMKQPYEYLKKADWLLVPSHHEAAPMVFDEARLMGVRVLTTSTLSAKEMIDSTKGIVCENSTEGLTNALIGLKKSEKLKEACCDNKERRRQLEVLLESCP